MDLGKKELRVRQKIVRTRRGRGGHFIWATAERKSALVDAQGLARLVKIVLLK